jgi:hydroxyacylglutathione hydrolase
MNKVFKIILWSLGGLIGLAVIAVAVYLISFFSATRAMSPAETGQLNDSVWCIRDKFVNTFIFRGDQGYLMVDAGISEKSFRAELDKTGITPDQITTLLLTHTDGDHIGATGLLKNAAVYMHRDEEQMINGTTGKMKFIKPVWKFGQYGLLSDNETLTIDGLNIKIIHTPGHTPGSSCYIIGSDYLVTGDNVIVSDGKYERFIEKFNMDTPQQIESQKLLPPPGSFKYILTAHNGVIRNGE